MKKFITIFILAFMCIFTMNAQTTTNVVRDGNSFRVETTRTVAQDRATIHTYVDSKGISYPIYLNTKGHAFIKKVSNNTGKEYKQYLPEDVSRTICKEMNVPYIETQKKNASNSTNSNS